MTDKTQQLKIEILEGSAKERSGKREDGTRWSMRSQAAYFHVGDAYPIPSDISLDEEQKPYAPGFYALSGSSFVRGKWGIELARFPSLIPLQGGAAAVVKS